MDLVLPEILLVADAAITHLVRDDLASGYLLWASLV